MITTVMIMLIDTSWTRQLRMWFITEVRRYRRAYSKEKLWKLCISWRTKIQTIFMNYMETKLTMEIIIDFGLRWSKNQQWNDKGSPPPQHTVTNAAVVIVKALSPSPPAWPATPGCRVAGRAGGEGLKAFTITTAAVVLMNSNLRKTSFNWLQ